MKVNYFLFCDVAAVTTEGKQIIHGVFDMFMSQEFPLVHPIASLAAEIFDCPSEMNMAEIIIRKKSGEQIFSQQMPLRAARARGSVGGPLRAGFMFRMSPLIIPAPGEYQVILNVNGEQTGVLEFDAIKV